MAGLLDSVGGLFSGPSPSLNVVSLDPGTQKLIGQQYSNATRSDAQIANDKNTGVAASGQGALQSSQGANQEAAGQGENVGMLQAIRNKYNQTANQGINNIVKQNQMTAGLDRAQLLKNAASGALAQQNVETMNYQEQANAMNQAEMARAQMLNSVLGAGGMIGGQYMARRSRRANIENMSPSEYGGME